MHSDFIANDPPLESLIIQAFRVSKLKLGSLLQQVQTARGRWRTTPAQRTGTWKFGRLRSWSKASRRLEGEARFVRSSIFVYRCWMTNNTTSDERFDAFFGGDHMLTSLLTAVVESSMVDGEWDHALYSSLFPKYCVFGIKSGKCCMWCRLKCLAPSGWRLRKGWWRWLVLHGWNR